MRDWDMPTGEIVDDRGKIVELELTTPQGASRRQFVRKVAPTRRDASQPAPANQSTHQSVSSYVLPTFGGVAFRGDRSAPINGRIAPISNTPFRETNRSGRPIDRSDTYREHSHPRLPSGLPIELHHGYHSCARTRLNGRECFRKRRVRILRPDTYSFYCDRINERARAPRLTTSDDLFDGAYMREEQMSMRT